MKKEDIEKLVGETMEDMGLEEHIEERTCECCGKLIEEDSLSQFLCNYCRIESPYCRHN